MLHIKQTGCSLPLAAILFGAVLAMPSGVLAQAIVPGFNQFTLPPNDDSFTDRVPLGFTVDFFGLVFTSAYVNNNGNITFDQPLATFTPFDLTATQRQIIAPFFADVDTRAAGDPVTYGPGIFEGRQAFGVNYINVDYFPSNPANVRRNSFQVILVDRSDIDVGDFDIVFNYGQIQWETGGASGGSGGLGGNSARVGYSNGTGQPGTFFELPGSAINGAFLDGGPNALVSGSLNSEIPGRYVFFARDGQIGGAAQIDQVIERINRRRWALGQIPPVKRVGELAAAAALHSQAMAEQDFFMSCNPDTLSQPADRINAAGYAGSLFGEVIGAGHRRARNLVDAWMDNPATTLDRQTLLDAGFREAGVGLFVQDTDQPDVRYSAPRTCAVTGTLPDAYRRYWTVDFGLRPEVYPVVIEFEAFATDRCLVDVYVHGEGFAVDMRLSADGIQWEAWRPYTPTRSWYLEGDPAEPAFVHAQIRNSEGQILTAVDEINLVVECRFADRLFADGFEQAPPPARELLFNLK